MTTKTTTTAGVIEHVDPKQIVVEANVRTQATLPKEFVASIKEFGVLTPIVARRGEDGTVLVRAGQRRTLAAREAGLASIPAYIVDGSQETSQRILEQLIENDQRESLSEADRVAAFQQLAFEGLTPTVIARKTGTKQAVVKQALAVAENPIANQAMHGHQLTLDQAATLIEFEDDEDTRAALVKIATEQPGQFEHAAQRARDDRERRQVREAAVQALTEAGVTVREKAPDYDDKTTIAIRDLMGADGKRVEYEAVKDLPGLSAHVSVGWSGEASVTYYLDNPKAHGFQKFSWNGPKQPMTDEDKAERKALIANRKAWISAETVRRQWIAQMFTRKTLPKNAAQVIAAGLTGPRATLARAISDGNRIASEFLGLDAPANPWTKAPIEEYATTHPARAQHVALAVVIGGMESATHRDTWRNAAQHDADYLGILTDWGYQPSEVEQLLIDRAAAKAETREAAPANATDDDSQDVDYPDDDADYGDDME